MSSIGIDIGTSAIRVNDLLSEVIDTTTNPINNYVSQSSKVIFTKILQALSSLEFDDLQSIAVSATCSMVVLNTVVVNGEKFLQPFNTSCCSTMYVADFNHDILLWMDNRAIDQTEQLNTNLQSTAAIQSVGDRFVPELGLPKLKWLSDNYPNEHLVCFELFDWISYLFINGGFDHNSCVKYPSHFADFADNSIAIDGSIKGWSKKALVDFGISTNIKIGTIVDSKEILHLGYPLGELHASIRNFLGIHSGPKCIVVNGCIDSYAGWIGQLDPNENYIAMTAGTSTCCILSTVGYTQPILGVWGPYNHLTMDNQYLVYAFGQPGTGKLYERLIQSPMFKEHAGNEGDPFQWLETKTLEIEQIHNRLINALIKNYFYYGDIYGNRTPYNDYRMSEMVIDGVNCSMQLDLVISGDSITSLVIRYNLIIEFLVFQFKQIIDRMMDGNKNIQPLGIVVSGSQSRNERFLQMLADVTSMKVLRAKGCDGQYCSSIGASIIATIGKKIYSGEKQGTTFTESLFSNEYIQYQPHRNHMLMRKYEAMKKMAEFQIHLRTLMSSDSIHEFM
jgi:ribulose kinase